MKVIVTCGPSFEPLDEVRRFTNFSTGELGILLARELSRRGFEVLCCRSTGTTYPGEPARSVTVLPFSTNADLKQIFQHLAADEEIGAVFHSAALCDFQVLSLSDAAGRELTSGKVSSRSGELLLRLKPTEKLIHSLRHWFPHALLVGWKYEMEPGDLKAKADRQFQESHTDACVLNGRAYGAGFGFYEKNNALHHVATKAELAEFLANWLHTMPRKIVPAVAEALA